MELVGRLGKAAVVGGAVTELPRQREECGGGAEEKGGMVGLVRFGSSFCTVMLHSVEQ